MLESNIVGIEILPENTWIVAPGPVVIGLDLNVRTVLKRFAPPPYQVSARDRLILVPPLFDRSIVGVSLERELIACFAPVCAESCLPFIPGIVCARSALSFRVIAPDPLGEN